MSTEPDYATYDEWVESRPEAVRELAKKFRPGDRVMIGQQEHWVVGFAEYKDDSVGLHVSPISPFEDYHAAIAAKVTICPSCIMHELPD